MTVPAAAQTAPAPTAAAAPADPIAQIRSEIDELKRTYQERLDALEKRLDQLQAGQPTPAAPAPEAAAVAPTPPVPEAPAAPAPEAAPQAAALPAEPGGGSGGGGGQTANYFNPSVSVIGNFLAVAGQNRVENLPSAELRESELGLQAIVDPYARADFFISFGEHGVDVEEGFATFTALPAGLLVKVGRMRPFFGKTNTLHLHVLPWPDQPLNVVDMLGPDGWIGTGVSVARLVPLPGDTFSEITLQAFRGDAEGLFTARKRGDLAYNGHYRVFRDLTESVNLDAGLSYADGPNDSLPDARTRLQGLDLTLRWKPLVTATYRSASFRGELFRTRREQPGGTPTAWAGFVSGEYQLAKRWFAGARYEQAEHPDDPALKDRGLAGILTFWPSEFSQLRAELRRRRYSTRDEATELLLQLQFAIGAHGAHPF